MTTQPKEKMNKKKRTQQEQAQHAQNAKSTIELNRIIAYINQLRQDSEETEDSRRDEADKAEQDLREECGDWFDILPPCPCCKHLIPPGSLLPKDSIASTPARSCTPPHRPPQARARGGWVEASSRCAFLRLMDRDSSSSMRFWRQFHELTCRCT
jgi:hypothetical protein